MGICPRFVAGRQSHTAFLNALDSSVGDLSIDLFQGISGSIDGRLLGWDASGEESSGQQACAAESSRGGSC